MGLFDFFKKPSSEGSSKSATNKGSKDISRLTRLVGNKLAQDYDRQEAIAQLSQMAHEDGARALLSDPSAVIGRAAHSPSTAIPAPREASAA